MTLTVGLAAARLVDIAACSGPDPIAQGSSTVLIDGLPASRQTDKCSHGGLIVGGEGSVLIGGAPVTVCIGKGDAAFIAAVQAALSKLLRTRSGIEWMRQMAANGRTITIVPVDDKNGYCDPDDPTNAKNGVGTDSTISWNPSYGGATPPSDPSIVLGHEMVHALHDANGQNRNGPRDTFPGQTGSSARNEERSTVGTPGPVQQPDGTWEHNAPDYSNDVPTENSWRSDYGYHPRNSYFPRNYPGGAPW